MKKFINFLAPAMLIASASTQADIIGGTVEASVWQAGISGETKSGANTIFLDSDLKFDDDTFFEIAASIELPVPVLPNLKIRHTKLEQTETGQIPNDYGTVSAGANVRTTLDLTHTDVIAYYEILDNWVSIDIGFDIKVFDGQIDVQDLGSANQSGPGVDVVLPLPYAKAEIELPFTGMAFGAEMAGISYSGSGLYDARARIRQNISLAFIELGYRVMGIKIDDLGAGDAFEVDAKYDGVYLSTGLDF